MLMKAVRKKQPSLVPGHIIGMSAFKMIGLMAVSAIGFVAGVVLVATWFVRGDLSVWALIIGIILLLMGPAGLVVGIFQLSVKERLIVGDDRFQVAHRVRGEDEVVMQFPYRNISKIKFEQGTQRNYVGIDLVDLDELDTYQKKDYFQNTKSVRSFHWVIDGGYTESLETIYELLKKRMEQHQDAQGK
jgi:hypothetical protein